SRSPRLGFLRDQQQVDRPVEGTGRFYSRRLDERQSLAISLLAATDGRRPDPAEAARIRNFDCQQAKMHLPQAARRDSRPRLSSRAKLGSVLACEFEWPGALQKIVLQFRAYGDRAKSSAGRQATRGGVLLPGLLCGNQRSADLRRLLSRHLPTLRNAAGIFG